ncbi:MAG: NAD(P)H-hydrate dehydratase, partial [Gemmatimonadetes bacterium]|nr:NAD(P)H-hydrate dehydratase [Gemmatimonadota bacterium]
PGQPPASGAAGAGIGLNATGPRAAGRGGVVVTPHPGEMARLVGASTTEVQGDRVGTAKRFAAAHGLVALLKGAPSLVAYPGGGLLVSTHETPSALAVAGMGDVLTGAIGAYLAQGVDPVAAAGLALHVTGAAASLDGGGTSLMPSDVVEAIPAALSALSHPDRADTDLPFPFVTFDQRQPA